MVTFSLVSLLCIATRIKHKNQFCIFLTSLKASNSNWSSAQQNLLTSKLNKAFEITWEPKKIPNSKVTNWTCQ